MVILGTIWVLARGASAQQPTTGNTQEQKGTASTTSSKPPVVPTVPHPDDAIENPVLDEADEEHITNMASHIALKYNHDELDVGPISTASAFAGCRPSVPPSGSRPE